MKTLGPAEYLLIGFTVGMFVNYGLYKYIRWESKKIDQRIEPLSTGKHYTLWSRKGRCPGCGARTGCKHTFDCTTRKEMLRRLKIKAKNDK